MVTIGDRSYNCLEPQPEFACEGDYVVVINPNMLIPAGSTGLVVYAEGGKTKVRLVDGSRSNWQFPVTLHRRDFVITEHREKRRTA